MVDYRKWFNTSEEIRRELAALHELDRDKDAFMLRPYSKRRARLVKMYWIRKGQEAKAARA